MDKENGKRGRTIIDCLSSRSSHLYTRRWIVVMNYAMDRRFYRFLFTG